MGISVARNDFHHIHGRICASSQHTNELVYRVAQLRFSSSEKLPYG